MKKPAVLTDEQEGEILEKGLYLDHKPSEGEVHRIIQNDYCYKEMVREFKDLLWATAAWTKEAQVYRDTLQSQLEKEE